MNYLTTLCDTISQNSLWTHRVLCLLIKCHASLDVQRGLWDKSMADRGDSNGYPFQGRQDFRHCLIEIADELGSDDVENLKFLCSEFLSGSKLQEANAEAIFESLVKRDIISPKDVGFLLECLLHMHQKHLVTKLGYTEQVVDQRYSTFTRIPKFRILLFTFSDECTTEELNRIKFSYRSVLSAKQLSNCRNMLQLFELLEKEARLYANNVQELEKIAELLKHAHLQNKIEDYKQNAGIQFIEPRESERSMVPDGNPSIMGPVAESLFGAYRMERNPRGKCVIINNVKFEGEYNERRGSDKDAESLTRVFRERGFLVDKFDNLTAVQMQSLIRERSQEDHTDFDAFVCCILTHGRLNEFLGTDNKGVPISNLTSNFSATACPTLQDKPKMFFMQSCQGKETMGGAETAEYDKEEIDASGDGDRTRSKYTPNEADMLLSYATMFGYVSMREPAKGSWYIQTLCEVLEKNSEREDLLSILTEVNRLVAEKGHERDQRRINQVPAPHHTLRKKIYLRKCLLRN